MCFDGLDIPDLDGSVENVVTVKTPSICLVFDSEQASYAEHRDYECGISRMNGMYPKSRPNRMFRRLSVRHRGFRSQVIKAYERFRHVTDRFDGFTGSVQRTIRTKTVVWPAGKYIVEYTA